MSYAAVLRHLQILQNNSGSHDTATKVVDAEPFKGFHPEMRQQFLRGGTFGKSPVVDFECKKLHTEISFEHAAFSALEKHFFGCEVAQQLIYIFRRALGCKKLSRADIQKRHTARVFVEMHGSQKVVLLVAEHIIIH